MGIEPTNHMISMRLNGFEDRGRHQPSKHFQMKKSDIYLIGHKLTPMRNTFIP